MRIGSFKAKLNVPSKLAATPRATFQRTAGDEDMGAIIPANRDSKNCCMTMDLRYAFSVLGLRLAPPSLGCFS
jgi:hypothetical protein